MQVVVSIDSFKGSLSTFQAGKSVEEGILRVYPNADVKISPIADGGEGTVDALTFLGGSKVETKVCGPLGDSVFAEYGILEDNQTAVIEMSAAAGITLVPESRRNPMHTTTFGVGEMILDAILRGCRKFIIGIGGSATNDGGVGMLQALGFTFLDSNHQPISSGAGGLESLSEILTDGVHPLLKECTFRVACDVKNPLCGENGCSHIFGPQKGANREMIGKMDAWLARFARLTQNIFPKADPDYPGAGAAGGMGFAFLSYLNAELVPGIALVMQETNLENLIQTADIVVTGEGRLDSQSCMGKAPQGVARLAKKYQKPVIAFSGIATKDANVCNHHGIDAYFPVLRNISTLEEALNIENASQNLADTAEQVFRLIRMIKDFQ